MKILALHCLSVKTVAVPFISADLVELASRVGHDFYMTTSVNAVFQGALPWSSQILDCMMIDNPAFKKAAHCPITINGLDNISVFTKLMSQELWVTMQEDGLSIFEAILAQYGHSHAIMDEVSTQCVGAIREMFSLMDEDNLAVGVFYDPTVALAAHFLGFEHARSLEDLESITFAMSEDGEIEVIGIDEVD